MTDSPTQFYKGIQVRTAKEAINSNLPSLATLKRQLIAEQPEKGAVIATAFITSIITDLVLSFNVGKQMTPAQVVDVVNYIQTDYYYLKPSELKYCFDKAKKGQYGKLYDRIDGAIIFEWIELYLEERLDAVITQNENQNNEYKKSDPVNPDLVLKVLKNVVSEKDKEEKAKRPAFVPMGNSDALNSAIQECFKEFDKLYLTDAVGEGGGKRFLKYKEKILDQDEYVNFRLNELGLFDCPNLYPPLQ